MKRYIVRIMRDGEYAPLYAEVINKGQAIKAKNFWNGKRKDGPYHAEVYELREVEGVKKHGKAKG